MPRVKKRRAGSDEKPTAGRVEKPSPAPAPELSDEVMAVTEGQPPELVEVAVSFMRTALDHALVTSAQKGDLAGVARLLELGADVSFTTDQGDSALGVARKRRKKDVVALLVAHGATVEATAPSRRPIPPPPVLRGKAPADYEAREAALGARAASKRRAAAEEIEETKQPRYAGLLVTALARELQDPNSWDVQTALIEALARTSHHPEVAAWLEEILVQIWLYPTTVTIALGNATVRVAARAGDVDLDRLLARVLGEVTKNDQRLAACAGILEAAAATGASLGASVAARVSAFIEAPGPMRPQEQVSMLTARAAWARTTVRADDGA
jgi:hypothetical protein